MKKSLFVIFILLIFILGLVFFHYKNKKNLINCEYLAKEISTNYNEYWNSRDTSKLSYSIVLIDSLLKQCPDRKGGIKKSKVDFLCALGRYQDAVDFLINIDSNEFHPKYLKNYTIFSIKAKISVNKEQANIFYVKADSVLSYHIRKGEQDTMLYMLYCSNKLCYNDSSELKRVIEGSNWDSEIKALVLSTFFQKIQNFNNP